MASYLPSHDGLLPLWILMVALTSIGNSIQCYSTLSYTRRLYAGRSKPLSSAAVVTPARAAGGPADEASTSPVTPLSARTFGTWTMTVAIVRLYAAYHISEPAWYQMALATYAIALAHFLSEAFVFGSARPSGPWLAPVTVAIVSLVWSAVQYDYYVQA